MKKIILFYLTFIFAIPLLAIEPEQPNGLELTTETLSIVKLSEHVYQHISYLETETWGKVACNGMIIIVGENAIIFDTPSDIKSTVQLSRHLNINGIKINAVLPTHFHEDCVGGLEEFRRRKIPIYISNKTLEIMKTKGDYSKFTFETFDKELEMYLNGDTIKVEYFGAGHTSENVTVYYNKDEALFGGCLVKELKADKGNLEDANVSEWPTTVKKIKEAHPNLKTVIPGHGKAGGEELLDYTIKLFTEKIK